MSGVRRWASTTVPALRVRSAAMRTSTRWGGSLSSRLAWNGLRSISVGSKQTDYGEPTLDGTLDRVGYQLFRDGLLPPPTMAGISPPEVTDDGMSPAVKRKLLKERNALIAGIKKNGVALRRSIKETAITIGCDEAGRGPLAGPVVAAAVSRLPMSSFNNHFDRLYEAPEQFQIFDSKSVSESQRDLVFAMITGHVDFFDITDARRFSVHHCGADSTPEDFAATSKKFDSHQRLAKLPFKKLLSMQTPYLISYHGYNSAGNYLYLWSIGIANHAYIDAFNIYSSSMDAMHRTTQQIWVMLNDARFSYEVAPRPKPSTVAQYLCTRYCVAAHHDHEKRYCVPHHIDLAAGATDYFDVEPIQPPLVLVDGHAVPVASHRYFTNERISGEVQPIIEGDKRSLSIAAASCLAKVTRDEIMSYLDALYPGYDLAAHKGYPVESHMKCVARQGVCPIHRRTFRPCQLAIERQQRLLNRKK